MLLGEGVVEGGAGHHEQRSAEDGGGHRHHRGEPDHQRLHPASSHPRADHLAERAHRTVSEATASKPRVIILTTFDLDRYVYAALSAGASGFLLKDVTPEHLTAAVRTVRTGDALLAPAITRRLVQRFTQRGSDTAALHRDLASLTPRELEVLGLLARGLSNAELAARLHLAETTVKTHVARILAKLGLRDRVQAVIVAYETGLVSAGAHEVAQQSAEQP
ncbi:LuxR C-terminal-related transcriptional regulator [Streptomyces hirsutus]|uniref:LuxR C-terminal-related transcriptional regulator n=1 Tax=Streptomyces hirsutus TaxID=35620 RepID=UPI003649BE55